MKKIISIITRRNNLEDIVLNNINYLIKQAYYYTGSKEDAEDLIQELFLNLHRKRSTLPAIEKVKPWLLRCLYNQFIDHYRAKKRQVIIEDVNADFYVNNAEGGRSAEEDKIYHEVMAALDQLPKKQRAIICLHDISGHSLPDLAQILQTPLGTLKSTLHRGRSALKGKLGVEPLPLNERYIDNGDR